MNQIPSKEPNNSNSSSVLSSTYSKPTWVPLQVSNTSDQEGYNDVPDNICMLGSLLFAVCFLIVLLILIIAKVI